MADSASAKQKVSIQPSEHVGVDFGSIFGYHFRLRLNSKYAVKGRHLEEGTQRPRRGLDSAEVVLAREDVCVP